MHNRLFFGHFGRGEGGRQSCVGRRCRRQSELLFAFYTERNRGSTKTTISAVAFTERIDLIVVGLTVGLATTDAIGTINLGTTL